MHQTFGLKNIKIHSLPSDRDQNFLLTNQRRKFVLKIYNYKESLSYIKMQIAALEHIGKGAFSYNLPELIGEINQVKKDCKIYNICLFTYVEGNFISNIRFRKNKIIGVGRLVGEVSSALQNFKYKKVI